MKNIKRKMYSALCFWIVLITNAQISTGTGGAPSILPNNPTSNANVGVGTNNPNAKLSISGSLTDGQTFVSDADRHAKSTIFNAGNVSSQSNYRMNFFDFPISNLNAKSMFRFSINDRSNYQRFIVFTETGGLATFQLNDKNQNEYLKINEDGNSNVYMHLPMSNSRIVIGGYGDYLPTHKFVVRGSAKIEGNILTDSNIGIGTSNFIDGADTYRLSVKGKIRAEEVKVYNTWADYVFAKDYKLSTLKEVEKYILKNGHLPNVPSAKEITEKGLELGEMTKIQQEKIEELTLYLIQQNKRIEEQNKDIQELKTQIKTLLEKK
jgi:hypothetical protein